MTEGIPKGIDSYLKRIDKTNTPQEREQIQEDLSDLVQSFRYDEDGGLRCSNDRKESLLELDSSTQLSMEDFESQVIATATDGNYSQEDVELLYNILDSDGDGILSSSELSVISNGESITRHSMWSGLYGDSIYSEYKQPKLTQEAVNLNADRINKTIAGLGSDMKGLEDILNDPNFTPDDIVDIIWGWEDKYGKKGESLMERIEDQWANSDDVQKLIAEKLSIAAKNGNKDAVALLAKQLKSATADDLGTADAFLKEIFKQLEDSPEVLADICSQYDGGYEQLIKDIKKDHRGGFLWLGVNKTGKQYIAQIEDAIEHSRS